MPGGRLRTYRLGDRAELLVEQLLAGFAFTTRVPRQEDFGVDFFCSLTRQEGQFLKAGPFFAVQAKSARDDIVYEKSHELEWIKNQENPLLICVADRNSLAMDVYSTWNLVCGVLNGWRGQRPVGCSLYGVGERSLFHMLRNAPSVMGRAPAKRNTTSPTMRSHSSLW